MTGSVNSSNNSSTVVTLAGVVPNGSNAIVLTTTVGTANDTNNFAYLNVLRLTSNSAAVPEPAMMGLIGLVAPALLARRRKA